MLHTAVPKPKVDFLREVLEEKSIEAKIPSIDDIVIMSNSIEDFFDNMLVNMTPQNINMVEEMTRG